MESTRKTAILVSAILLFTPIAGAHAQEAATTLNTCDSRPIRALNTYDRDSANDIYTYSCASIEDIFAAGTTTIRSRRKCSYEKTTYYDYYSRNWATKIHSVQCLTTPNKDSAPEKPIPDDWHTPLLPK